MSNGTKPIPIKIGSREELMTLPPGLYELPTVKPQKRVYDALQDLFFDADTVEIARVMEMPRTLPNQWDVTVRPDGRCILTWWDIVPGTEKPSEPLPKR